MDPATEQRVLSNLYDRLWQAITYTPGGDKAPAFPAPTTFLQFSKGIALDPADFANARSPMNPNGNFNAAVAFSSLVDPIPDVALEYADSGRAISKVYKQIANGANTKLQPDGKQLAMYKKAYDFLNVTTEIPNFDGSKTRTSGPSAIKDTYDLNRGAYAAALSAYQLTALNYDLDDPADQRKFQAQVPVLRNGIDQAYSRWRSQGAAQVEQAMAALSSSINSGVQNAIEDAQRVMKDQVFTSERMEEFYLAYALPREWAGTSAPSGATQLTLSSSKLNETSNSTYASFGANASYNAGLWRVGGGASGSRETKNTHMDTENFDLRATLYTVRIFRPWLNMDLFSMDGWAVDGIRKNGVSNGQLKGDASRLMPILPTGFVVARDVEITADWGSKDTSFIKESLTAKASVGWGPFSVSATTSMGRESSSLTATFDGGTLKFPGLQVVGWINSIVPPSPPLDKP